MHEVVATEETLKLNLFSGSSPAEVIISYLNDEPVGFALFFHNFSAFLCKSGIYLEDLYFKPEVRGHGIGQKMLGYIAQLAIKEGAVGLNGGYLNGMNLLSSYIKNWVL